MKSPSIHVYKYDANGNMVLDSIGRIMKDGHIENLIDERKLLWDDENRLMAISDNGYVSTYRYDDAGNRAVKLSGYGEAVFVNGSESGNGVTQTNKFSAYPNPYMVYNGSKYFKHIYIGSERIVSKVSVNNPDYDPRQEDCAGNSLTGYTVKLQSQQQALSDSVASIYAKFEVPYYPNNNDDYGYNWSDGLRRSITTTSDSYGELAYFYHSDHLGSTSYVTDATGAVSQYVEYVPFGEVFIEERNNTWNTPYLFNAKELDEETGLYYYGARYYDPRTSLWLSTDPMELKYPNISTYTYCVNNPIKLIDPQGTEAVYNLNGDYLGSTKEGFTGEILIHVGEATILDISNYSRTELQQKYSADIETLDDVRTWSVGGISNENQSKIWTHIASQFEGTLIYDKIFTLKSGQIGYAPLESAGWFTNLRTNNIYGTGEYDYKSTIENIASSIIVHEWYSHLIKRHYDYPVNSHRLAYKNVINYKPLWDKTTDDYKSFNLKLLLIKQ